MWITQNFHYTSSQVLAAGCSPTSSAAKLSPSAPSKSRSTRSKSSRHASPDSQSGMMSRHSAQTTHNVPECLTTYAELRKNLSLPEDFRVKIYLAQVKARVYAEREAASGPSMRVSFARYDRATSSWKTPQNRKESSSAVFLQGWQCPI